MIHLNAFKEQQALAGEAEKGSNQQESRTTQVLTGGCDQTRGVLRFNSLILNVKIVVLSLFGYYGELVNGKVFY